MTEINASRSAPRVGFVRMGPHPIPNRLLPDALASALGGAHLEILNLEERMRRDPIAWLINPFFVVWEHGRNLMRGRVSPWRAFFTTTFLFRRMSRVARRWIERTGVEVSFQIQSLFDARSPGTPHFVYTDHTHLTNLSYRDFDRRTLLGRRWIELERRLYRGATTVFTRSRNISTSMVEAYGCDAGSVLCVGAGSNVPIEADGARESSVRARPAAPELLFVGADWKRKGGPELVEAFRRLREKTPDLRLTIIGCRPDVDLPGVRALGSVPLEEVRDAYVAASIFCLPTHREPFGVAFLEAMHHGLPIVSTRVGAVPELVGDSGCGELVDVGDVDGLTRVIDALLADPERARAMGERGRSRARERFTWTAVAARMAAAMAPSLASLAGTATRGDVSSDHETAGDNVLPLRSEFAG